MVPLLAEKPMAHWLQVNTKQGLHFMLSRENPLSLLALNHVVSFFVNARIFNIRELHHTHP